MLGKTKIAEKYAWAAPTLVGKTLYVRDRKNVMAFDLGGETDGAPRHVNMKLVTRFPRRVITSTHATRGCTRLRRPREFWMPV